MRLRAVAPSLAAFAVGIAACTIKQEDENQQLPASCNGVTEGGSCEGTEVVFCRDGQVERVDCAQIDATCELAGDVADCAVNRSSSCGELTALGTCEGAVMRYCDSTGMVSVPRDVNCAAYGQLCDPTGANDGGAICVPHGPCSAQVTEEGICNGNQLSFCENGETYIFDCGVDQCDVLGGFADCYVASKALGCGTETAAGRCEGQTRVNCQGNVVAREDCAKLGLECRSNGSGGNACLAPTSCKVSCPKGTSCQSGACKATQTPAAEWTFMVYIVGDNNLSSAASQDLNEMEVVGSTAQVNIVTEVEFSQSYGSSAASYDGSVYRMKVQQDADKYAVSSLDSAQNLGQFKMSDPVRLTEFLRWTAENHPAKRYALVMWDHGQGYKEGFVDGGGSITLSELVDGIRNSGVHLNLVTFDACLMAMHEVAYAMRGVADTMVASEETEPGGGYPYDAVMSRLVAQPTMTPGQFGKAIVEEYSKYYTSGYLKDSRLTQATIDLTKIEPTHVKLASFVGALNADATGQRAKARSLADSYDIVRYHQSENADFVSVAQTFTALGTASSTAGNDLASWLTTSGTIVHSQASGSVAASKGLAIFLPEVSGGYYGGDYVVESYKSAVSFLPMQPWISFASALVSQDQEPTPAPTSISHFAAVLSWGDSPTSGTSKSDLDLYVFEPNGDFGTPANGTVTENGFLSNDSYDSELSEESYELAPNHQSGTYLVLVHFFDGPAGEVAYPKLQIYRDDLPGGSKTLLRGKVESKKVVEYPMSNLKPLTQKIDANNFQGVLNLDYSNVWYATTIEVD